jgi:hypothetical protein
MFNLTPYGYYGSRVKQDYVKVKQDGNEKSPNSVLHFTLRHSTYIRTPRSSGFVRLEFGTFFFAIHHDALAI